MTQATDINDLRTELVGAADRMLQLFTKPNGQDELAYPVLARITERVQPRSWNKNRTSALREVIQQAIGKLPRTNPDGLSITWQELGVILFGFRSDLPLLTDEGKYGQSELKAFAQHAAKFYGSEATWGRRTKELRKKLAEKLLEVEVGKLLPTLDPEIDRRFVERPDIIDQFEEASREQATGVICFVGPRGSGKSTLAREFAIDLGDQEIIMLDASEERAFYDSLGRGLAKRGVAIMGRAKEDLTQDFKAYLFSQGEFAPVVLVDDVTSWDLIKWVVDPDVNALFLITSNEGDLQLPIPHSMIEVGPMEPEEAERLARILIVSEQATDEDCRRLADEVGHLPLAISHASVIINEGWLTVDAFIVQHKRSVKATYKPVGSQTHRSLTLIYNHMLSILQDRCPEAAALLEIFAILQAKNISMGLARQAHAICAEEPALEGMSSTYAFARAVSELRRLRLLQVFQDVWSIHKLTHALVGDLTHKEKRHSARLSIIEAFSGMATDVLISRGVNGVSFREFIDTDSVVMSLEQLNGEEARRIRIGRVVNALVKLHKMCGSESFGPKALVACVFKAMHRGGGMRPVEDLDSLELYYARLIDEYRRDVLTPRQFTTQLSAVVRFAPTFASPGDHEHVLWGQIAQIETCLVLGNPDASIDHSLRALEIIQGVMGKGLNVWRGEVFLLMAEAHAQLGKWRKAQDLYEFASVCGGGYFPNRYNESDVDKPFNYPSVYHPDLYKLLSHIRRTLFAKTEESGV